MRVITIPESLRNGEEAVATRIAIDGPVGSGKTTVGRGVAGALGYRFLDTGLMYRAATLLAYKRCLDLNDEKGIIAAVMSGRLKFSFDEDSEARVTIDTCDVTGELRSARVDRGVSSVSALPNLRTIMVDMQRAIAGESHIVMVGRDIGTVVLPDAELKVFLTASPEVRARRRYEENRARGVGERYERVLAELRERDKLDSSRESSPLRPAMDSIELCTDDLELEEVVREVIRLADDAA